MFDRNHAFSQIESGLKRVHFRLSLAALEQYFRRFGFCERLIADATPADLGLAVVVPCFNEPALEVTLEAIWNCERPSQAVEAIVVVNSPIDAGEAVRTQNRTTLSAAREWLGRHQDAHLRFHFLDLSNLPPKQAGVGLARKIGMDEALRRFADVEKLSQGVIVCLDADSGCDPNYLKAIEAHFRKQPKTPGASIYFEHPLAGSLPPPVYRAAALYELHLRYYVQALRFAGFPYAFHTIGSAMAVRAHVYMAQGGMNKRKAGEDFYFLQKVIALGGFSEINDTRVIPSPRESDRVPFGTGRAVTDQLKGIAKETYPFEAFLDLKSFWARIAELYRSESVSSIDFPDSIRQFLAAQNIDGVLSEIRENTADLDAFVRRFVRWFDGFVAMKFVHFARDRFYGARPVASEAARLLEAKGIVGIETEQLLSVFRKLDRFGSLPNPPRTRKKE